MLDEYLKYYNNERYQWDLKKMTPVQNRNHLLQPSYSFYPVSTLWGTVHLCCLFS